MTTNAKTRVHLFYRKWQYISPIRVYTAIRDFSPVFVLNLSMICSDKKNMDYYYSCAVAAADKPLPGLSSAEELIGAN